MHYLLRSAVGLVATDNSFKLRCGHLDIVSLAFGLFM